MQTGQKHDILPVSQEGYIACPVCRRNKRLLKIYPDTEAEGLRLWCRDCKTEIVVNIARGQSVERRSP